MTPIIYEILFLVYFFNSLLFESPRKLKNFWGFLAEWLSCSVIQ